MRFARVNVAAFVAGATLFALRWPIAASEASIPRPIGILYYVAMFCAPALAATATARSAHSGVEGARRYVPERVYWASAAVGLGTLAVVLMASGSDGPISQTGPGETIAASVAMLLLTVVSVAVPVVLPLALLASAWLSDPET